MALQSRKYSYNVTIAKDYGSFIKVTEHKVIRNAGIECDDEPPKAEKGTVNEEKLLNNISRAKSNIQELVFCNPWDLFATLTIDGSKYERFNLNEYYKKLTQLIRDCNKKHGTNIKYILIPEKHENGAWHIHGFFHGLPIEHLELFSLPDKLPKYIRKKLKNGEKVYNWLPYSNKFGWCVLEPIRNSKHAGYYVMKYITKDLYRCVSDMGSHLYRGSQGLKKATLLKRGTSLIDFGCDYENEYIRIATIDKKDGVEEYINKNILTDSEYYERTKTHDTAYNTDTLPTISTGTEDKKQQSKNSNILPKLPTAILKLSKTQLSHNLTNSQRPTEIHPTTLPEGYFKQFSKNLCQRDKSICFMALCRRIHK